MVRDRKPDGAGIEADQTTDWFLAQLRGTGAPAERLPLKPPAIRNHPAPRSPVRPRLVQAESTQSETAPSQAADDSAREPGGSEERPRPVTARRTMPRPIAARSSLAAGRVLDEQEADSVAPAEPDAAARVLRAPARRPTPIRRVTGRQGADRPAPRPPQSDADAARGSEAASGRGAEHPVDTPTDLAAEEKATDEKTEPAGLPEAVEASPRQNLPRQKRVTELSAPKRVVDIQRHGSGLVLPLPVVAPDPAAADIGADPETASGANGDISEAGVAPLVDTATRGDGAAAVSASGPEVAESAPALNMVPDTERSAPKAAVAHVAMVETDSPERARGWTLIPQLFAASVVGFIVVAAGIGTLLPSDTVGDPSVQNESVPSAPADEVEQSPTFTPAPTQTPELVIPDIPLDGGVGTGDAAAGLDAADLGVGQRSTGGSPAADSRPPGGTSPGSTPSTPGQGTSPGPGAATPGSGRPGSGTSTGGGTGSAGGAGVAPGTGGPVGDVGGDGTAPGVPAEDPVGSDDPGPGDGPGPMGEVGEVVVDLVGGILP